VLFIDARHIYRQVTRALRDWTPAQIGFLGNIARLYRGEAPDTTLGGDAVRTKLQEIFGGTTSVSSFKSPADNLEPELMVAEPQAPYGSKKSPAPSSSLPSPRYKDVPGLCKAATLAEIEAQGWSLNPGRYVGVAPGEDVSDEDFKAQLVTLNEELETLNIQARNLEATIAQNVSEILES